MPTRTGTKPSTYTYDSGSDVGTMEAGWIFVSGDVSGSSITDLTGNGNTLTLQGTASVGATDATHGDCLDPGTAGANLVPPAGWDSLTNYTIIMGGRCDADEAASAEAFFALENTASAQDSCNTSWATSENTQSAFEDADSGSTPVVVDGLLLDSGKWFTVASVCDGTGSIVYHYIIVDGEATGSANNTTSGITGSTTNNLFTVGDSAGLAPFSGLVEYCYVYSSALSSTDIEALHVDPYLWDNAGAAAYTFKGLPLLGVG